MDKRQLTRIEKELAKLLPDDEADQARVDKLLHDLNKIYGDGQGEVQIIESSIFKNLVDKALRKVYGEENPTN